MHVNYLIIVWFLHYCLLRYALVFPIIMLIDLCIFLERWWGLPSDVSLAYNLKQAQVFKLIFQKLVHIT
jgi:hypothetical protein